MDKNPITATVKTPASNFTGDVWMNPVFGGGTSLLTCGLVRFTPGARTNWHSHANGQLLVCTDGIGLVGTRERQDRQCFGPVRPYGRPAGEEHFHGGTASNMMCHYAILDAAGDGEATVWLEPVTDEQYTAAHSAAGM